LIGHLVSHHRIDFVIELQQCWMTASGVVPHHYSALFSIALPSHHCYYNSSEGSLSASFDLPLHQNLLFTLFRYVKSYSLA
jgi:hypothetical protein